MRGVLRLASGTGSGGTSKTAEKMSTFKGSPNKVMELQKMPFVLIVFNENVIIKMYFTYTT